MILIGCEGLLTTLIPRGHNLGTLFFGNKTRRRPKMFQEVMRGPGAWGPGDPSFHEILPPRKPRQLGLDTDEKPERSNSPFSKQAISVRQVFLGVVAHRHPP